MAWNFSREAGCPHAAGQPAGPRYDYKYGHISIFPVHQLPWPQFAKKQSN